MKSVTLYCMPLVLIALPSGAMAQADAALPQIDPRAMSMNEIRAHNAKLDRKDRKYIVCRTSEQTGSLARKNRICRTNGEWDQASRGAQDWTNGLSQSSRGVPIPPPAGSGN
ncbi:MULTISPECIES: hypothetical protein [unclassified Sphingopyxis]|uniref:hypothetical protein n=1 Tax=unclassified Sphingopyxis TaxID=2614943 RepID=UPI000AA97EE6|nr:MULTISPECIES: hypothetical protein [unclassified Sphingopyxis]